VPARDFRLWVALHETTHRVQFGATPWLRTYLKRQIDTYLGRAGRHPTARGSAPQGRGRGSDGNAPKGVNGILLLLTPEQRELFKKMQALMSLLEGHASFVMNEVGAEEIRDLDRLKRSLKQRRQAAGIERSFQRAIGFDQKISQYDAGEAFVRGVVDRVGIDGSTSSGRARPTCRRSTRSRRPSAGSPASSVPSPMARRPPAVARVLERVTASSREHQMFLRATPCSWRSPVARTPCASCTRCTRSAGS